MWTVFNIWLRCFVLLILYGMFWMTNHCPFALQINRYIVHTWSLLHPSQTSLLLLAWARLESGVPQQESKTSPRIWPLSTGCELPPRQGCGGLSAEGAERVVGKNPATFPQADLQLKPGCCCFLVSLLLIAQVEWLGRNPYRSKFKHFSENFWEYIKSVINQHTNP